MPDPKSPRGSLQERLQRSRRHRTWASNQLDGASVGGDCSIASTENTFAESSDKNIHASNSTNSSANASATATQLKTYRLQKIKQKIPSRHNSMGGTSSTTNTGPTMPSGPDNISPQSEVPTSPLSSDEKRDASVASLRRERISQINLKSKKTPGSPTKSSTVYNNPGNGPAKTPALQPLDIPQVEREYSGSNGKHQPHSPCESMMYQASAMEEEDGDNIPVSSEGPPPGPRVQRMQRDGSKYRQVASVVQSWKNQNKEIPHPNIDDESESISTSASSTDWKSRRLVVAGGTPWGNGAGGTPEVPRLIHSAGRFDVHGKGRVGSPEVLDKQPSRAKGSPQHVPYNNPSAGRQSQRPSVRPSNGAPVHGGQEPPSNHPRHYGNSKVFSAKEFHPQKQTQYGGKVVVPVHASVTHARTYDGRAIPAKESSPTQTHLSGNKFGQAPLSSSPNTHPPDNGGQMYKNVLKPRKIESLETLSSDKPDYSASIETPKSASVSSLRATFNSNKNQPIMPMNSTDPRVRHSLPISNKRFVPEAPASPAKLALADESSVSGSSRPVASYRSKESAWAPQSIVAEAAGRSFKPNQPTRRHELDDPSPVVSGPIVSQAGVGRDGVASRYRSAHVQPPAKPTNSIESRDVTTETAIPKVALPSNEGATFRQSSNPRINQKIDPIHKRSDLGLRRDSSDVLPEESAEEMDVNARRTSAVAPWTQNDSELGHDVDEVLMSTKGPSPHPPKDYVITKETTTVRTEVIAQNVDKHENLQTNKIRQYYKASWRVEQEDCAEVDSSQPTDEQRKPDPTTAAPTVTRGSVAASWQQRVQPQNQRNVVPLDTPTPDILKSKTADVAKTGHTARVTTHHPLVASWQQKIKSQSSKESSTSSSDEKKLAESPPRTEDGALSRQPVTGSQEIDHHATHGNDVESSPTEATADSPRQSLGLAWQQKALSMQKSKDSSSTEYSSENDYETTSTKETDQQQNPVPQSNLQQTVSENHNVKLPDTNSSLPMVEDFGSGSPEPVKSGALSATRKPWEKDTKHNVLQSWQSRSSYSRENDVTDPVMSSIPPNEAAREIHESLVSKTYDDEDLMEEKKSGDLSVDEDRILGLRVNDSLGHYDERTDYDDSLKETSKRLSYDGGIDSYISAETSNHEDDIALHPSGSGNLPNARSLTEMSSEEISVYVEDERMKKGKTDRILKEHSAKLNQKGDSESDQRDVDDETSKDISSPNAGRRFPRLSPSPRDNDKYRNSYFGDEALAPHRGMNRKKHEGSNNIQPGHRSISGDGASQVMNFWASTSASHEEHQEALNFKETDRWLDRDPDIDDTIADDVSISSEANEKKLPTTPQRPFQPKSQEPAVAGFDSHASSAIKESTTWTTIENLNIKSRPTKEKQDVFDPFGPENDDLKVDVSAELFSPNPDPFMTEESFSPLEWSTPHGAANSQHIGYYNSPDSRVEI